MLHTERLLKRGPLLLILLWGVLTLININKAFHIDDTFHLEAARYLTDHPGTPMSGLINWQNNPTPLHDHNQPPLFFYLISLYSALFGTTEVALHLLMSVFTFLALYYFQKLAVRFSPNHSGLLLALFALNPALVANQNLMVDVPVLAIVLGMAYCLIHDSRTPTTKEYLWASLLLGIGMLIKYSMVPLFGVVFLLMVLNRHYKKLWLLGIPVLLLAAWSVWNLMEYGSVHFLDRPKRIPCLAGFSNFIACLGAIAPFAVSFAYGTLPSKWTKGVVLSLLALWAVFLLMVYTGHIGQTRSDLALVVIFTAVGLVVASACLVLLIKKLRRGIVPFLRSADFATFLFLASIGGFIALMAPFMATRHVLLVLPFILLFGRSLFEQTTRRLNALSLVLTTVLGMGLGIADWKYADYYRQMAASFRPSAEGTVWAAGHWGWQWYSAQNGMKQYQTNGCAVKSGDLIVFPVDITKQEINDSLKLELIDKKWLEADILTFASGKTYGSFYSSNSSRPPWNLSRLPIDTLMVYRIVSIKSAPANR